jgi:hypothetical protein
MYSQLVKTSKYRSESEGSLPGSPESALDLYPDPDECSPQTPILLFEGPFPVTRMLDSN